MVVSLVVTAEWIEWWLWKAAGVRWAAVDVSEIKATAGEESDDRR